MSTCGCWSSTETLVRTEMFQRVHTMSDEEDRNDTAHVNKVTKLSYAQLNVRQCMTELLSVTCCFTDLPPFVISLSRALSRWMLRIDAGRWSAGLTWSAWLADDETPTANALFLVSSFDSSAILFVFLRGATWVDCRLYNNSIKLLLTTTAAAATTTTITTTTIL